MKNPLKDIKEVQAEYSPTDMDKIRKKYINISLAEYLLFCKENGFSETFNKSAKVFKKEKKLYDIWVKEGKNSIYKADLINKKNTIKNNIRINKESVLSLIKSKDTDELTINSIINLAIRLKSVWFKLLKNPMIKFDLPHIYHVHFIEVLEYLVKYESYWIRNLDNFKIKSKNSHKNVIELFNHLLVKHSIPYGMYSLMSKNIYHDYLFHVSTGNSPKEKLPIDIIPKNQVSNLMKYLKKDNWGISVRKTQLDWLKVDKHLHYYLLRIPDMRVVSNNVFEKKLKTYIHYIAQQGMIDGDIIDQLFDYYIHRCNNSVNYNLNGKNLINLINEMENWHKNINKNKSKKEFIKWEPSGISSYSEERKSSEFNNNAVINYSIKELLNSSELLNEGNKQHHCVGSYTHSCSVGRASIFSLRETVFLGEEYTILATIEVRGNCIVQAKSKRNGSVSSLARTLIQRWANANQLECNF